MRIDLYTKFVLTVIALCLIWLSVGGPAILPGASAQGQKPIRTVTAYERIHIAGWVDSDGHIHEFSAPQAGTFGLPVSEVGRR